MFDFTKIANLAPKIEEMGQMALTRVHNIEIRLANIETAQQEILALLRALKEKE